MSIYTLVTYILPIFPAHLVTFLLSFLLTDLTYYLPTFTPFPFYLPTNLPIYTFLILSFFPINLPSFPPIYNSPSYLPISYVPTYLPF